MTALGNRIDANAPETWLSRLRFRGYKNSVRNAKQFGPERTRRTNSSVSRESLVGIVLPRMLWWV